MLPELSRLATPQHILAALGALYGSQRLCGAVKRVVAKECRDLADLHRRVCDLYVECYRNWYRTQMRLRRLRLQSDDLAKKRVSHPADPIETSMKRV